VCLPFDLEKKKEEKERKKKKKKKDCCSFVVGIVIPWFCYSLFIPMPPLERYCPCSKTAACHYGSTFENTAHSVALPVRA